MWSTEEALGYGVWKESASPADMGLKDLSTAELWPKFRNLAHYTGQEEPKSAEAAEIKAVGRAPTSLRHLNH